LFQDSPEDLAQRQLNAYNARDIEAFLEPYSEDVEVYTFPDKLEFKGKVAMRKNYGNMFETMPHLHCELESRMVVNNTVIDKEKVVFDPNQTPYEAIAIYKIEHGKIARVYFTN